VELPRVGNCRTLALRPLVTRVAWQPQREGEAPAEPSGLDTGDHPVPDTRPVARGLKPVPPKSAAKESSPSTHQIAPYPYPYPYPYPIIASRTGRGMGTGKGSDRRVIIKQLLNLDDWLHCDETTSQSARAGLLVSMRLS